MESVQKVRLHIFWPFLKRYCWLPLSCDGLLLRSRSRSQVSSETLNLRVHSTVSICFVQSWLSLSDPVVHIYKTVLSLHLRFFIPYSKLLETIREWYSTARSSIFWWHADGMQQFINLNYCIRDLMMSQEERVFMVSALWIHPLESSM